MVPKKSASDLIGGRNRFSGKIVRQARCKVRVLISSVRMRL